MKKLVRLIFGVILVLMIMQAPAAFAQGYGYCYVCRAVFNHETGEQWTACRNAPSLVYGSRNCEWGELDTNSYYCSLWGEACCLDPI
ncbi:MAG TPA: hypothetical protein VEK57_03240 [Thermoanaerobaculia bacterium]|nr:hypothetical protein [Thermoanaerobaculia bacterium]